MQMQQCKKSSTKYEPDIMKIRVCALCMHYGFAQCECAGREKASVCALCMRYGFALMCIMRVCWQRKSKCHITCMRSMRSSSTRRNTDDSCDIGSDVDSVPVRCKKNKQTNKQIPSVSNLRRHDSVVVTQAHCKRPHAYTHITKVGNSHVN